MRNILVMAIKPVYAFMIVVSDEEDHLFLCPGVTGVHPEPVFKVGIFSLSPDPSVPIIAIDLVGS